MVAPTNPDVISDDANIDTQDNISIGSVTSQEQGDGDVAANILEDKIDIISGPNKDMHNITPHVDYCGYSIPHPSEAKLNLRIQTSEKTDAVEALKKGLEDLAGLCLYVESEFQKNFQEGSFAYDSDSL
ncbi:12560_t:CDS:2 [Ambispora leptoticha]|uniref:12560_t:CDS:1 n=1 Tax=Ambispora leptoticha TaxID=144679 RepID=A0A9N8VVB9_9GLOM|nr:12560_t:CDS:2 [Ambispora leptoticha]